ncbi:glycoside hydrolase family 13 protein [Bipolaris victoriae FI3]|uniref:Glycoside hydrolase family 13 protein n=1 Tax=Bipolaris victoriae (strain FI3) TaxID=930091 RepID=W7EN49_BIPV3|nr:glycoside hydrolase family 13 protein [Bipolaris victoriae FI3]
MPPDSRPWWQTAIGYQIWPASFKDSNSDGIGDLNGVLSKLDYLRSLEIDLIWFSPVYDSPNRDMGYDVSDYESIHPQYGTVADMENLIKEAKKRNIKIVMDMVTNHSSDKHHWFLESCKSRSGPYSDFYIWRDPKYDSEGNRQPPNNWRTGSRYGKSTWKYVEARGQYYFCFGTTYQPNLNWFCDDLRRAVYDSAVKFWLERGVDGFRMDLVGLYWKDPTFPDAKEVYPGEALQPLDGSRCLNGEEVHVWLKELKERIVQDFGENIVLIGELPSTDRETFLRYISPESKELEMALDTDIFIVGNEWTDGLYELKKPELPLFKDAVLKTQSLLDDGGWPTAFLENHDFARSVSRFGPGEGVYREAAARMLALMAATLSGTFFIYQGQEIGMTNVPSHWGRDDFKDNADLEHIEDIDPTKDAEAVEKSIDALTTWGRDNGRTPVQWSDKEHAGFSDVKPWIRVIDNYTHINVEEQLGNPNSIRSFWVKMMKMRKEMYDVLACGLFCLVDRDNPSVFSYTKVSTDGKSEMLVVLNFSSEESLIPVPIGKDLMHLVCTTTATLTEAGLNEVTLQPWEGRLYRLAPKL